MRRPVPAPAALALLALLAASCTDGPGDATRDDGTITEGGLLNVFDVAEGDCLSLDDTIAEAAEVVDLMAVPCSEPHLHEVYHLAELEGVEVYPGPSELSSASDAQCLDAFEDYVGIPYLDTPLQFTYLFPTLDSWQDSDRTTVCILVSSQPTTGSAAADAQATSEDDTGSGPAGDDEPAGDEPAGDQPDEGSD